MKEAHRDKKAESIDDLHLEEKDQFALEMDHMADCVMHGKQPHTPGEEGLQDHLLMEAVYLSAANGQPVSLPKVEGRDITRGPSPTEA